jgi:hypothetical protein
MNVSKNKILSVRIERVCDDCPDTSYFGKFSDDAEPGAIVRIGEHSGKFLSELSEDDELPEKGREYRYFNPALTGEETGNPESPKQDWQRMERLNNGDWCFIGVIAKAVVISPNGLTQTLRSGGLWGIESDSDNAYFASVEKEQLDELRAELESFGFGARQITYAFKDVTH